MKQKQQQEPVCEKCGQPAGPEGQLCPAAVLDNQEPCSCCVDCYNLCVDRYNASVVAASQIQHFRPEQEKQ